jgi:mannose PTS system EIIA component
VIGLVLITHGNLAYELVSALEHVAGEQENIKAICVQEESILNSVRSEVEACLEQVDQGEGVVLLTDMFGGTPSNIALSFLDRPRTEILAGVNLPMLIKLAEERDVMDLKPLVLDAQEAGRKYINVASEFLSVANA